MKVLNIRNGITFGRIPAYFRYNGVEYANKFTVKHLGKDIRKSVLKMAKKQYNNILTDESFKETYDWGWYYILQKNETGKYITY